MTRDPRFVAFAGDWHCNPDWAVDTIRDGRVAGAEVIVHLGDFGYEFPASYLNAVEDALADTGIELWFVDGNHECFPVLERFPLIVDGRRQLTEHIFHLPRGFRWTWSGIRFLAVGGAYSIDRPWRQQDVSWWAGETITDDDVAAAVAGGPVDALVAHDCPAGVPMPWLAATAHLWRRDDIAASDENRALLARIVEAVQPRWVWHGHYHHRYTAVVDLGYGPVRVEGLDCDDTTLAGNVLVVDLAAISPSVGTEVNQ